MGSPHPTPDAPHEAAPSRLRDVVITGLGAITACGPGVASLWESVLAGRGTARWLDFREAPGRWAGCPVAPGHLEVERHPALRRQDRHVVLAAEAALEAIRDAALDSAPAHPARRAVVWGTSRGPMGVWDEVWNDSRRGRRPRPTLVPAGTLAAAPGALSILLGASGPAQCISAACSSGAHAIASAARLIACGEADVAIAGGSDSVLAPITLGQFEAAGLLAHHEDPRVACRPFDRARNGTVFGDGAGAVVLESAEHAASRGARVWARLAGWGLSADARARIEPDPDGVGIERCVSSAMAMAGLTPGDVAYINLHGTGTVANDAAEAAAVRRIFGRAAPACGSTKGVTGHCVGATATLEAIVAILSLHYGQAPPSANLIDPAFEIPLVRGSPAPVEGAGTLTTSAGFWGLNACLAFTRPTARG